MRLAELCPASLFVRTRERELAPDLVDAVVELAIGGAHGVWQPANTGHGVLVADAA